MDYQISLKRIYECMSALYCAISRMSYADVQQEVAAICLRFGDAMDTGRASTIEERSAQIWLENSPEGGNIARHCLEGDTSMEPESTCVDVLLCGVEAFFCCGNNCCSQGDLA